jgi:hypothetical protein
MKINYKSYAACLMLVGLFTSCSDKFLDRPPLDNIVDANYYKTNEQVLAGTAPLYNLVWFAYNDKASHGIGDARGGVLFSGSYQLANVQMNTTGDTEENNNSWRSFYNIVGQSNTVINNVNKHAGSAVTNDIKQHAIAEARFMRGLAYSYLVQNWGAVPIIENNTTLLTDTTIARNTIESVWQFVIRDMRFATENLPVNPVQTGRLTKWAAEGMLAKMYLTRSGVGMSGTRRQSDLDSAAYFAKRVIDNSGKSLLQNYEDLFKTANNNNQETLFALQWKYDGNWGTQNSVQAYLAYGSSITGFGDGWGGDIGASKFMLEQYEDLSKDERRKATFMLPGDHYNYIHEEIDDPDKPGSKKIVELTVKTDNNNTAAFRSRAHVKKYVVGRPEDNGGRVQQQRTEIQTYMLRLADVYLIYAEAILGNNDVLASGEALNYFNLVRARAGLEPKASATWEDIHKERLIEFAMEGQAWYEYVRLHYYNPQLAYTKLSTQDRGNFNVTPDSKTDPTAWTITEVGTNQRTFPVSLNNFIIPIPTTELSRAPNLRKEPVPYEFK